MTAPTKIQNAEARGAQAAMCYLFDRPFRARLKFSFNLLFGRILMKRRGNNETK